MFYALCFPVWKLHIKSVAHTYIYKLKSKNRIEFNKSRTRAVCIGSSLYMKLIYLLPSHQPKQTEHCKKTHIRVREKLQCLDKRCLVSWAFLEGKGNPYAEGFLWVKLQAASYKTINISAFVVCENLQFVCQELKYIFIWISDKVYMCSI